MVFHRWGRHLELRGGIENLLDRTYWRWADVRGLGPDDPTISMRSQRVVPWLSICNGSSDWPAPAPGPDRQPC